MEISFRCIRVVSRVGNAKSTLVRMCKDGALAVVRDVAMVPGISSRHTVYAVATALEEEFELRGRELSMLQRKCPGQTDVPMLQVVRVTAVKWERDGARGHPKIPLSVVRCGLPPPLRLPRGTDIDVDCAQGLVNALAAVQDPVATYLMHELTWCEFAGRKFTDACVHVRACDLATLTEAEFSWITTGKPAEAAHSTGLAGAVALAATMDGWPGQARFLRPLESPWPAWTRACAKAWATRSPWIDGDSVPSQVLDSRAVVRVTASKLCSESTWACCRRVVGAMSRLSLVSVVVRHARQYTEEQVAFVYGGDSHVTMAPTPAAAAESGIPGCLSVRDVATVPAGASVLVIWAHRLSLTQLDAIVCGVDGRIVLCGDPEGNGAGAGIGAPFRDLWRQQVVPQVAGPRVQWDAPPVPWASEAPPGYLVVSGSNSYGRCERGFAGAWAIAPSLGYCARVRHPYVVVVPGTPVSRSQHLIPWPTADFGTLRCYLLLEACPVDHRQCCQTDDPLLMSLARHPDTRVCDELPARIAGRICCAPVTRGPVAVRVVERDGKPVTTSSDVEAAGILGNGTVVMLGPSRDAWPAIADAVSRGPPALPFMDVDALEQRSAAAAASISQRQVYVGTVTGVEFDECRGDGRCIVWSKVRNASVPKSTRFSAMQWSTDAFDRVGDRVVDFVVHRLLALEAVHPAPFPVYDGLDPDHLPAALAAYPPEHPDAQSVAIAVLARVLHRREQVLWWLAAERELAKHQELDFDIVTEIHVFRNSRVSPGPMAAVECPGPEFQAMVDFMAYFDRI